MDKGITIDLDARDTLVDLMGYRYFVVGDLRIERDIKCGVDVEDLASQFRDDLALWTDLGWLRRGFRVRLDLPEPEKTEFELTLPRDRLRSALARASADADELSAAGVTPIPGSPDDLFDRAACVCDALIAEIDRTEESE